jgi:hypothetical protein
MSKPKVPDEKYMTHAMACLSEGMCPDCQTLTMRPKPTALTDFEGTTRTAEALGCLTCGEAWWPASIANPGKTGWSTIGTEDSMRQLLAARTWDGRWKS